MPQVNQVQNLFLANAPPNVQAQARAGEEAMQRAAAPSAPYTSRTAGLLKALQGILADRIRIYEDGALVADHLPIDGRGQTRLDPGHCRPRTRPAAAPAGEEQIVLRTGDLVARRSLDVYDAIGRGLAGRGGEP